MTHRPSLIATTTSWPLVLLVVATVSLCAMAQTTPPPAAPPTQQELDSLPAGPGKVLVQIFCVSCHSIKTVTSKRGTEEEWDKTVDKMISAHGAPLSDADADTVVNYLSTNFGPSTPKSSADATSSADKSH